MRCATGRQVLGRLQCLPDDLWPDSVWQNIHSGHRQYVTPHLHRSIGSQAVPFLPVEHCLMTDHPANGSGLPLQGVVRVYVRSWCTITCSHRDTHAQLHATSQLRTDAGTLQFWSSQSRRTRLAVKYSQGDDVTATIVCFLQNEWGLELPRTRKADGHVSTSRHPLPYQFC